MTRLFTRATLKATLNKTDINLKASNKKPAFLAVCRRRGIAIAYVDSLLLRFYAHLRGSRRIVNAIESKM